VNEIIKALGQPFSPLKGARANTTFVLRTGPLWRRRYATVMSDRIECARCRIAASEAKPAECLIDIEAME